MNKDFVVYQGRKYPIIYMKKGSSKTDDCPFCGHPHEHARKEGHRRTHCVDTRPFKLEIELSDGSIANIKDGYYLVIY